MKRPNRTSHAADRSGSYSVTMAVPRVLAVIATSLVGGVACGSLIGWFLRSTKCSGRAWLPGSSSTMPRSQQAAIANKAAVGWLRRVASDLVGAEAYRAGV